MPALAVPVWAAPAKDASADARDDVVVVVFSDAGGHRGTVTLSYPEGVSQSQVQQDLVAMQTVSDWRFSPAGVKSGAQESQATAVMRPAAHIGAYGEPVWPAVWALRRFNRVTVVVMGSNYQGRTGNLENKYVRLVRSGGGMLWSYDATVLDRTFATMADLCTARPEATTPEPAAPTAPQPRRNLWPLALIALAVGGVAYFVTARAGRGKGITQSEAKHRATLRSRRARNMR
ncbi:hypothetical protein LLH03_19050 [bacterium]|nr:hypothetical protein [bacterium]